MSLSLTGPLTFLMILRWVPPGAPPSMSSTRAWVTPPREPVRAKTFITRALPPPPLPPPPPPCPSSSSSKTITTTTTTTTATTTTTTSKATGPKMSAGQSRLMKMAGWVPGEALGKHSQGIIEPIEAVQKLGKAGLGRAVKLQNRQHLYEAVEPESLQIKWAPVFLASPQGLLDQNVIAACCMDSLKLGPLPPEPDESFCPRELQKKVWTAKSVLDDVDRSRMMQARNRSNPFEMLKKEFYQNRAALKMAELDALCDRVFTAPPAWLKSQKDASGRARRSLLYFADVCAGPGGFSEYMLHALKWRAKGFGFTLAGKMDFKLSKFNSNAPTHSFKAYYGQDETGDITVTANMQDFAEKAWKETGGKGLDVVLADGGFLFEGKENLQELLVRQLVLCQCTLGMALLKPGGVLLVKVFDTWTPFTVHVCFLVSQHFDRFAIVKPHQSRPANSERYLLGVGFKSAKPKVVDYLYQVNDKIRQLKEDNPNMLDGVGEQVLGLVPSSLITEEFSQYVQGVNVDLATKQINSLNRLQQYIEDPNLPSDDQAEVRRKCLEAWELKDSKDRRTSEPRKFWLDPFFNQKHFSSEPCFFQEHTTEMVHGKAISSSKLLYRNHILKELQEMQLLLYPMRHEQAKQQMLEMSGISDWWAYRIPANGKRMCIMSSPRGIFCADPKQGAIKDLQPLVLGIPPDSILDVVMVEKGSGEVSFYLLDAWSLPNEPDFYRKRDLFEERTSLLALFVEAIREPCLLFSRPVHITELLKSVIPPGMDLYLLRGNGPKPSPSRLWRSETASAQGFTYQQVQILLQDLVNKQQERRRLRKAAELQRHS
eukprot:gb/GEZN01001957.1/.p1 GENE.gb/GEZN01001957.1/~~gb/GEZN01001957.1/.p1  ORF type:complete len:825 (-),score=138.84 gb/GEZN01001957.1/:148-2622(-)